VAEARRDLGLFTPAYDIDPAREADYLAWLHGEHLPRTLAEGSFTAISHFEAVEAPKKFQLLELMPSYLSFHSPGRQEAAKRLPPDVAAMMALRLGQVRNHHAEVTRADGPAEPGLRGGIALGPVVHLLRFDLSAAAEPGFNAWLMREHLDAARAMPGLLSLRRYLTVEGAPKNLLLYEFASVEAFRGGAFEAAWATPWAREIAPALAHGADSRVLYRRIWHQG